MGLFKTNISPFFIICCVLFFAKESDAQKPILFQVPSSTTQIQAAASNGDNDLVAQYERSDNQIKNAIYADFRTYFKYGAVYFFKSEDYENVKNGDLKEVAFVDNTGATIILPADTKEYYTANISFFPKVYNKVERNGEEVLEETPEIHFGLGIILRDEKFNPLSGKLRFTDCKIAKRGSLLNKKKRYYVFRGSESLNRKMARISGIK